LVHKVAELRVDKGFKVGLGKPFDCNVDYRYEVFVLGKLIEELDHFALVFQPLVVLKVVTD
jgi:hypothetical protein